MSDERFDDLFDGIDDPAERDRLRRVHELLLTVESPPGLVPPLRRERRRAPLTLVAAALAAAAFGGGYLLGDRGSDAETVRTIAMSGVGEASGASATIELREADGAGNWPMVVRVRGLEPNGPGYDFYELWLTKDGKLLGSCGRFKVRGDRTDVSLSVPYPLQDYDGWVVTRGRSEEPLLTT
jgi:hypothetical protein